MFPSPDVVRVYPVSEVSHAFGLSRWRVEHVLRKLRVCPVGKIGRLRVFDGEQVMRIEGELERTYGALLHPGG